MVRYRHVFVILCNVQEVYIFQLVLYNVKLNFENAKMLILGRYVLPALKNTKYSHASVNNYNVLCEFSIFWT